MQKNGYKVVPPLTSYAETDLANWSLMSDTSTVLRFRWQRQNHRLTTTLAFCDNAKRVSLDSSPVRIYRRE